MDLVGHVLIIAIVMVADTIVGAAMTIVAITVTVVIAAVIEVVWVAVTVAAEDLVVVVVLIKITSPTKTNMKIKVITHEIRIVKMVVLLYVQDLDLIRVHPGFRMVMAKVVHHLLDSIRTMIRVLQPVAPEPESI